LVVTLPRRKGGVVAGEEWRGKNRGLETPQEERKLDFEEGEKGGDQC